jgi:amino-acid N-acetyltransferase
MLHTGEVDIIRANGSHRQTIITLLQTESLPVEDLPRDMEHFFVAVDNGHITGVAGLEQYEDYGLLRSLVVHKQHRNKSIASAMITTLEKHASDLKLKSIYLLTETAAEYFSKKGYSKVAREQVPDAIRQSSQFSSVCPATAVVLKKELLPA